MNLILVGRERERGQSSCGDMSGISITCPALCHFTEHKPIIFQPQLLAPFSVLSSLAKPAAEFYSCFCQLHSNDDNSVSSVCPRMLVRRLASSHARMSLVGMWASCQD